MALRVHGKRFASLRGAAACAGLAAAALLCLILAGCGPAQSTRPQRNIGSIASAAQTGSGITFENVAERAGIRFALGHDGRSPLSILETAGGGCAFLDYDQDGWPDILLVGPHRLALYHNAGNGTFKDVTATSHLAVDQNWMGCAVGDYDGDGLPDIFLTGYHCCALYHNLGHGRFEDVTRKSGIDGLEWSMSAVFADLTGSGRLDLFVTQYVRFNSASRQLCQVGSMRSACGPEMYPPIYGRMFRNIDGKHFEAVAVKHSGKTWGALASHLTEDGAVSIYLANDMVPGNLLVRHGAGWHDDGSASGTALDASGNLQGGMGVDSGDYDNDGRLDLLVTTYFQQQASLYHNEGHGLFSPAGAAAGLDGPTRPYVKFGCAFADFDNDGWLDLVMVSGHVRDNVKAFDHAQNYRQPIQVFHNRSGHFEDISGSLSSIAPNGIVGRGLSIADYDRDGRIDVLICDLEGRALLLHNLSRSGHWLTLRLAADGPNRHGLGALVSLRSRKGKLLQEVKTCGSVLSARDPIAHFGLGDIDSPVEASILWPDRTIQKCTISALDREVIVRRGRSRR